MFLIATLTLTQIVSASVTWWNTSYQYGRQLNVTTGANTLFDNYSSYTARFFIDTTDPKRFQFDCDDVRVIYYDGANNI